MIPDPNWLLSTIVQSTAAFVAIVAGFVISRLLAISAERSSLQAKVRDTNLQLSIKEHNLDFLENQLLEWDAKDFLEDPDVVDMLIESRGQISLAEAIKQTTGHNRNEDELRAYWDEAVIVTENALKFVEDHFFELGKSNNIDVFLKNHGANISSYRMKIYTSVFDSLSNAYNKQQNPYGFTSIMQSNISSSISSIDENNRYCALEKDIETIRRDKNALETLLFDFEVQLRQLGQPQSVQVGIYFLAYFSLVGIVIPVFFLPLPPERFSSTHKWSFFLLFISGLVFFFIYLYKLVQQLGERSNGNRPD